MVPLLHKYSADDMYNLCTNLGMMSQSHACNPRYFAFYPYSSVFKFVLDWSALVIKWFKRLSEGPKETWHEGMIPQPPGNTHIIRIIGKRRPDMDRQKSDEKNLFRNFSVFLDYEKNTLGATFWGLSVDTENAEPYLYRLVLGSI